MLWKHRSCILNHRMHNDVRTQMLDCSQEEVEDKEVSGGRAGKAQSTTRVPRAQLRAWGAARDQEQVTRRDASQDLLKVVLSTAEEIPNVLAQEFEIGAWLGAMMVSPRVADRRGEPGGLLHKPSMSQESERALPKQPRCKGPIVRADAGEQGQQPHPMRG